MYAVVLLPGVQLDHYVRDSWKQLKDLHISKAMMEIEPSFPHMTLAQMEDIADIEDFTDKLQKYFREQKSIPIQVEGLAVIPYSGTIVVAPPITDELYRIHRNFYEAFNMYKKTANPYYMTDRWNPHFLLALNLSKIGMTRAMACLLNHFIPFQTSLEEAVLLRLHTENGRCVGSEIVTRIEFV